jgi:hypothetical protein
MAGQVSAGPSGQVRKGRARARVRCRVPASAIAGDGEHHRTREEAQTTRIYNANHIVVAPLLLGHRRRRGQQWRTAARNRTTASYGKRDHADDI